jgi:5-methylcytosine-specific restriction endonuclease McrA
MGRIVIPPALRQAVAERSQHRCCYCQSEEETTGVLFVVDQIIPEVFGGSVALDNLCLTCWSCSLFKKDRIVAIDPETKTIVRLFHPREQNWQDHFSWKRNGLLIAGLTSTGRATVNSLQLNRAVLLKAREHWLEAGWHPLTAAGPTSILEI